MDEITQKDLVDSVEDHQFVIKELINLKNACVEHDINPLQVAATLISSGIHIFKFNCDDWQYAVLKIYETIILKSNEAEESEDDTSCDSEE